MNREYFACTACETAWADSPTCWMCNRSTTVHREVVGDRVNLDMASLITRGRFFMRHRHDATEATW